MGCLPSCFAHRHYTCQPYSGIGDPLGVPLVAFRQTFSGARFMTCLAVGFHKWGYPHCWMVDVRENPI